MQSTRSWHRTSTESPPQVEVCSKVTVTRLRHCAVLLCTIKRAPDRNPLGKGRKNGNSGMSDLPNEVRAGTHSVRGQYCCCPAMVDPPGWVLETKFFLLTGCLPQRTACGDHSTWILGHLAPPMPMGTRPGSAKQRAEASVTPQVWLRCNVVVEFLLCSTLTPVCRRLFRASKLSYTPICGTFTPKAVCHMPAAWGCDL